MCCNVITKNELRNDQERDNNIRSIGAKKKWNRRQRLGAAATTAKRPL